MLTGVARRPEIFTTRTVAEVARRASGRHTGAEEAADDALVREWPVDAPTPGETIGRALQGCVEAHGDRDALVSCHEGIRLTYAQLAERVELVARALLAAGVEHGDRVGIWAPNCAEWVVIQYATARVGAILVNVNPSYRTARARLRAAPVGAVAARTRRASRASAYAAMVEAPMRPACARDRAGRRRVGRVPGRRRRRGDATSSRPARPGSRSTSRSTSSTRRARRASRRARRCRTTTSSTTASSSARSSPTRRRTGSASRCRSTTASAW